METFKQTTCLPLLRSSYNGLTKSEQQAAREALERLKKEEPPQQ